MFTKTTALSKILNLKKKIRAVCGGTAASKTISIIMWLIDYGQSSKNEVITVVSESVPHLKGGAIRDFKSIMVAQGYWNADLWNETGFYTFESGTILEFKSFDKFGKSHGPRRDILFLNEANNLDYAIVDQLITRTKKVVWIDWNPSEEFWFYTEMLPNRKDIDFITLTYLDNEALDKGTLDEILAHKGNKNWWKVYGEGQLGEIEGRVYTGWQVIDEIPPQARLERLGLDFGYTNDPTAIVAVYYMNGGYILDEVAYTRGLSNKQIAEILLNNKRALVVADSAEPKSIDEIKSFGLNIIPTTKGKDSVNQGIQVVQGEQISITKRSVSGLKEYRNYLWQTDKSGRIINVPESGQDHFLDSARYSMTSLIPIIRKKEFARSLYRPQRRPLPNPAR